MKKFSTEAKVGAFIALALLIIAYITVQVSELGLITGGSYKIYVVLKNAEGVTPKTPVQVAGIPVGSVGSIKLQDNRQALVEIKIKKGVTLGKDVETQVRTRGVLGDTYIELIPGSPGVPPITDQGIVQNVRPRADYADLYDEVRTITENVKAITESMKVYTALENSHTARILKNMDTLTADLAKISNRNVENMNVMIANLRDLSENLRDLSKSSSADVESTLAQIDDITTKINKGEGTLGRLLNDDSTVEKTNEFLDNLSDITGGIYRLQTELGYHMEYLGTSNDVKNYVSFKLQPRPDKFFLFEVVHDPSPPASTSTQITNITNPDGTVTTVSTEVEDFNEVRFSAEFGKKFKDFTLRGGLIESTGGFGVDYEKGPIGLAFSAFDFTNSRPHLKFLTQLNITPSLYILGGVDDFISSEHDPDWLLGFGLRFTDDDIKSLIGAAAGAAGSFAR
jgi:phospholipid/cholesterol/gamma-HCH transport system substrate-binding protein